MKFSVKSNPSIKSARAAAYDVRVHFKNTRETAATIKGMRVENAILFLKAVIKKQTCIPFRRYNGGVGRTGQAKVYGVTQGRWPVKSCKFLVSLLENLLANAEGKDLSVDTLRIAHISVHRARPGRRRTYKAHGRINPYMSSPCHVQIIAKEIKEKKALPYEKSVIPDKQRTFQLTVRRLRAIKLSVLKKEREKKKPQKEVIPGSKTARKGRKTLRIRKKKIRGYW